MTIYSSVDGMSRRGSIEIVSPLGRGGFVSTEYTSSTRDVSILSIDSISTHPWSRDPVSVDHDAMVSSRRDPVSVFKPVPVEPDRVTSVREVSSSILPDDQSDHELIEPVVARDPVEDGSPS